MQDGGLHALRTVPVVTTDCLADLLAGVASSSKTHDANDVTTTTAATLPPVASPRRPFGFNGSGSLLVVEAALETGKLVETLGVVGAALGQQSKSTAALRDAVGRSLEERAAEGATLLKRLAGIERCVEQQAQTWGHLLLPPGVAVPDGCLLTPAGGGASSLSFSEQPSSSSSVAQLQQRAAAAGMGGRLRLEDRFVSCDGYFTMSPVLIEQQLTDLLRRTGTIEEGLTATSTTATVSALPRPSATVSPSASASTYNRAGFGGGTGAARGQNTATVPTNTIAAGVAALVAAAVPAAVIEALRASTATPTTEAPTTEATSAGPNRTAAVRPSSPPSGAGTARHAAASPSSTTTSSSTTAATGGGLLLSPVAAAVEAAVVRPATVQLREELRQQHVAHTDAVALLQRRCDAMAAADASAWSARRDELLCQARADTRRSIEQWLGHAGCVAGAGGTSTTPSIPGVAPVDGEDAWLRTALVRTAMEEYARRDAAVAAAVAGPDPQHPLARSIAALVHGAVQEAVRAARGELLKEIMGHLNAHTAGRREGGGSEDGRGPSHAVSAPHPFRGGGRSPAGSQSPRDSTPASPTLSSAHRPRGIGSTDRAGGRVGRQGGPEPSAPAVLSSPSDAEDSWAPPQLVDRGTNTGPMAVAALRPDALRAAAAAGRESTGATSPLRSPLHSPLLSPNAQPFLPPPHPSTFPNEAHRKQSPTDDHPPSSTTATPSSHLQQQLRTQDRTIMHLRQQLRLLGDRVEAVEGERGPRRAAEGAEGAEGPPPSTAEVRALMEDLRVLRDEVAAARRLGGGAARDNGCDDVEGETKTVPTLASLREAAREQALYVEDQLRSLREVEIRCEVSRQLQGLMAAISDSGVGDDKAADTITVTNHSSRRNDRGTSAAAHATPPNHSSPTGPAGSTSTATMKATAKASAAGGPLSPFLSPVHRSASDGDVPGDPLEATHAAAEDDVHHHQEHAQNEDGTTISIPPFAALAATTAGRSAPAAASSSLSSSSLGRDRLPPQEDPHTAAVLQQHALRSKLLHDCRSEFVGADVLRSVVGATDQKIMTLAAQLGTVATHLGLTLASTSASSGLNRRAVDAGSASRTPADPNPSAPFQGDVGEMVMMRAQMDVLTQRVAAMRNELEASALVVAAAASSSPSSPHSAAGGGRLRSPRRTSPRSAGGPPKGTVGSGAGIVGSAISTAGLPPRAAAPSGAAQPRHSPRASEHATAASRRPHTARNEDASPLQPHRPATGPSQRTHGKVSAAAATAASRGLPLARPNTAASTFTPTQSRRGVGGTGGDVRRGSSSAVLHCSPLLESDEPSWGEQTATTADGGSMPYADGATGIRGGGRTQVGGPAHSVAKSLYAAAAAQFGSHPPRRGMDVGTGAAAEGNDGSYDDEGSQRLLPGQPVPEPLPQYYLHVRTIQDKLQVHPRVPPPHQ